MKSVLIFLAALGAGLGIVFFQNEPITFLPEANAVQSVHVWSLAQSSHSRTVRSFGQQSTINYTEYCKGRCRCDSYFVTETVAKPGIITASIEFDAGPNPSPRCPGIGGTHNAQPVPGNPDQCYVCPQGMLYSSSMRGGEDVLRRWNFGEHVCVKVERKCTK